MNMAVKMDGGGFGLVCQESAGRRELGVWEIICWAFQREFASVDFDEVERDIALMQAVDPIYTMMRQGCMVDGGGRSAPHHDADIVAATLAVLPEALGGRRTAVWIAELARVGRCPDWFEDVTPRIYPADTHTNRHGTHAKTADSAGLGSQGWPKQPRRNRKQAIVYDAVRYCPCVVRPTAVEVDRARKSYINWWLALLDIRVALQSRATHLTSFVVTDTMPPRTPWKKAP